jgi:hypothetical protein
MFRKELAKYLVDHECAIIHENIPSVAHTKTSTLQQNAHACIWVNIIYKSTISTNMEVFFLERPNLFAICNNTFSKWWGRMACRRVLSSTPLLVRGSETGGDSLE